MGGLHPGGCPTSEKICIQGALHLGGLPNPRGSASRGVCIQGGWGDPLPPVNRMTHKCKNITLPQTSFVGGKNMKRLLERTYYHICNDNSYVVRGDTLLCPVSAHMCAWTFAMRFWLYTNVTFKKPSILPQNLSIEITHVSQQ